jgi:transposase
VASFCGIDIAKDSFQAAVLDGAGGRLWSGSFRMVRDGFQSLLQRLGPAGEVQVGMEATGIYFRPLAHFLKAQGYAVWEINPLLVSKFAAESTLRKTKTDRRDADTIAEFLRQKISTLRPPVEPTDLQAMGRARESLQTEITRFKNNLKRYLTLSFPEILRLVQPFTASGLALLSRYPSSSAVLAAPSIQLPGRKGRLTAAALRQAAATSIGLSTPIQDELIRSLIRTLQAMQAELAYLTELLLGGCLKTDAGAMASLRSIPGVGEITSAHFLAETQGRPFRTYRSLIAYAGLDPAIAQSGQQIKHGRITKRGNKSLRRTLFLMAQSAVQRNPLMNVYYQRKRSQGKAYRQAILCVAHKLIRLIFALLAKQELYQPACES